MHLRGALSLIPCSLDYGGCWHCSFRHHQSIVRSNKKQSRAPFLGFSLIVRPCSSFFDNDGNTAMTARLCLRRYSGATSTQFLRLLNHNRLLGQVGQEGVASPLLQSNDPKRVDDELFASALRIRLTQEEVARAPKKKICNGRSRSEPID